MAEITRDEIADIIDKHITPVMDDYGRCEGFNGIGQAADSILAWLGDGWKPVNGTEQCGWWIVYAEILGDWKVLEALKHEFEGWIIFGVDDSKQIYPTHVHSLPSPPKESV